MKTFSISSIVKGICLLEALALCCLALSGCRRSEAGASGNADATSGANSGAATLTVHYYRFDGDYTGWNLWVWPKGGEGRGVSFDGKDADGFVSADILWSGNSTEFGILIRRSEPGNDWAEKDVTQDRFTSAKEVWLMQNDEKLYTAKPAPSEPPILAAVAESADTVVVQFLDAPADYGVFAVYQEEERFAGSSAKGKTAKQVVITLSEPIADVSRRYVVRDTSGVYADKPVRMGTILNTFYYDGDDLGAVYSAAATVFKLWSPAAARVELALYDDAGTYNADGRVTDNETDKLTVMEKDSGTGVWQARVAGDLAGKYYLYRVSFADGTANYAADPYAKAVSANGQRMAVVNLAATNPRGWNPAAKPAFSVNMQDAVIYELHVRDFSIDADSGMTNKGTFLAFTETGTTNSAGVSTGVDHLRALGVTHVHLLPSFDFASIDESSSLPQFNWGYDPQNYNVPEGSYSTDAFTPTVRISEFKRMVQALHNAGIRVVMDVVYNHTYTTGGGPFDAVVPQYYYRTTLTGEYANGSACGNEVASERPMVRKFIADSCLYWAREYGVDGFRFDLMGLIDVPTMEHITKTLRAHDPTMLIYGEPWQAGGSVLDTMLQTTIGKQKGKGFAVFNDRIREAIKGGSDDGTRGFATGAAGNEKRIVNGVMGSISDFTERASESINYVTAHDNLNLWDKIAISYKPAQSLANAPYSLLDPQKPLLDNDAVKSVLLANGIIFTSQGIPFFQAGDEFLRSKAGDSNSYASPDSVNQIRWANAATYRAVTDYYAGLIRLRKEHPAFRMDSRADIERHLAVVTAKDRVVAFMLKDNAGDDSWEKIFVAYNANNAPVTLDLPESGAWQQVVNGQGAGTTTLDTVSDTVTLPGLSMAVLYQ